MQKYKPQSSDFERVTVFWYRGGNECRESVGKFTAVTNLLPLKVC